MGLVGQDGGEGDPRVVVDGDVQILVAGAARLFRAVAMHAMAGLDDPGQALDIKMDEAARVLMLITNHRGRRVERAQTVEPGAAQNAAHRGPAQAQSVGNPPAVVTQSAKRQNLFQ